MLQNKNNSDGRILIAGDLFPTETNHPFFSQGDIASLFGDELIRLFKGADLTVCNLEGALTDGKERCVKTGPVKTAPTSSVNAYRALGIDCCLLANNHVTDGGHQGVLDTMRTLSDAGIRYLGAGKDSKSISRSFIQEVGGLRIGFYNVSETMYNKPTATQAGVWLYDEYVVCAELKQLNASCDYLIVVYHGGIEKFPFPSPETRKRFHRMADNGADLIVAQHTHCIGCEENYNGSYLLYGQGDFLLKNFLPGKTDTGLLLELVVRDGKVEIKKHPVRSEQNLFVRYAPELDFASFDDRSQHLQDEEYVMGELRKFCDNELRLYLTAFKNPSGLRLKWKRYFPAAYKKWLFTYSRKNLLFTLHTLRSEQNRETAIIGLEDLAGLS